MQVKKYEFLHVLLLAGLLASCGSRKEAAITQAPTVGSAPAAPMAVQRPVAPTDSTTQAARPPSAAASVSPSRQRSGAHSARPEAPASPPRSPIVSTTLRAREPEPAADSLASLPASGAEAAAGDLAAWRAQGAAPVQTFEVRPGRDTVLVGQQGTRIVLPGTALAVAPGGGPVHLELREFYGLPDMILEGLSTTSGDELLETGGMLHLRATQQGQPVALHPGEQLLVQMPATQRQPGMQLFEGVATPGHGIDWQLPAPPAASPPPLAKVASRQQRRRRSRPLSTRRTSKPSAHPQVTVETPQFRGGYKKLVKTFHRLLLQSPEELARLRRWRRTAADRRELIAWSKNVQQHLVHHVVLRVTLDSLGLVRTVEPRNLAVAGSAEAAAAVRQLPPFRPATVAGLPGEQRAATPITGELQVLYAQTGEHFLFFTWDKKAVSNLRSKRYAELRRREREALAAANRDRHEQFVRRYPNLAQLLVQQRQLDSLVRNDLVSGGLGWINCDRFRYSSSGPQLFSVRIPDPATVVTVVFKRQRSLMNATNDETGRASFQAPNGQPVTLVALRRQGGITYLATHDLVLGEEATPELAFAPITLAELRRVLARL